MYPPGVIRGVSKDSSRCMAPTAREEERADRKGTGDKGKERGKEEKEPETGECQTRDTVHVRDF